MAKKSKKRIIEVDENQPSLFANTEKDSCTGEQKKFIEYEGKSSLIIAATAGSGKTFSSVQRLKFLLKKGVNPEKIIFFSFTKAAIEELKIRIGNDAVKITTIHAFAYHILAKIGKFKKIASFYDFIKWFKNQYKPNPYTSTANDIAIFENQIFRLFDEMDYISSSISAYKLQVADNVKLPIPDFYHAYQEFLKKERSRDFADMLIEVRDAFKEDKWLNMFKNKYDYIFIDEYQDTSTIQLQVLLALNAQYYYLIGDRNQAIYGYSGVNCELIEGMLRSRRKTVNINLTVNFRSDKNIINNSNRFSSLKAIPNSDQDGFVSDDIMISANNIISIMSGTREQVVVLARTNAVIKNLEFELLKRKYPIRYFNYINLVELETIRTGDMIESTNNKVKLIISEKDKDGEPMFSNAMDLYYFIKTYENSNNFITSIHKSKGREFDQCIVVNSISPFLMKKLGYYHAMSKKQLNRITFNLDDIDQEQKNIHYVAISRSKHKLYFMIAN